MTIASVWTDKMLNEFADDLKGMIVILILAPIFTKWVGAEWAKAKKHACKNVFVKDAASITSTGTQNPSLNYMALTARLQIMWWIN